MKTSVLFEKAVVAVWVCEVHRMLAHGNKHANDSWKTWECACVCLLVLTSIWTLSPGWSSERRSSSAVGWAAPAWRRCGAPHRPSTGFYRPGSSPCWNPAASPGSQSVSGEEKTTWCSSVTANSICGYSFNQVINSYGIRWATLVTPSHHSTHSPPGNCNGTTWGTSGWKIIEF